MSCLPPNNYNLSEQMVLKELLYQRSHKGINDVYKMAHISGPYKHGDDRDIYGTLLDAKTRRYNEGSSAQATHIALMELWGKGFLNSISVRKGHYTLTDKGLKEALYLFV